MSIFDHMLGGFGKEYEANKILRSFGESMKREGRMGEMTAEFMRGYNQACGYCNAADLALQMASYLDKVAKASKTKRPKSNPVIGYVISVDYPLGLYWYAGWSNVNESELFVDNVGQASFYKTRKEALEYAASIHWHSVHNHGELSGPKVQRVRKNGEVS